MKKRVITLLAAMALSSFVTTSSVKAQTAFEIGDSAFTRVDAIDIASYQKWMTQDDFYELKNRGLQTIVVKTTEGGNYKNPWTAQHIEYARNAGLNIAVYHYSHYRNPEQAREEAVHAISYLEELGLSKSTLIFNDLEDKNTYNGLSEAEVVASTKAFFDTFAEYGYTNLGLYTYQNYRYRAATVDVIGPEDTWIAMYPNYAGRGSDQEVLFGQTYGAWQFSSKSRLNGSSFIDANVDYNGLLTTRANLGVGLNWNSYTNELVGVDLEAEAAKTFADSQRAAAAQYNRELYESQMNEASHFVDVSGW